MHAATECAGPQPALGGPHAAKGPHLPWVMPGRGKGMDQTKQAMIQLVGTDQGSLFSFCHLIMPGKFSAQQSASFVRFIGQGAVRKIPQMKWACAEGQAVGKPGFQNLGSDLSQNLVDAQGLMKDKNGIDCGHRQKILGSTEIFQVIHERNFSKKIRSHTSEMQILNTVQLTRH